MEEPDFHAFVLDEGPIVSYVLRCADWQAVWVGRNVRDLFGYSAAEVLRPAWWVENLHPDDRAAALEASASIAAAGEVRHRYRFRHKRGDYWWVQDTLPTLRTFPASAPV